MTIAVHQPNYLPNLGFFHKMKLVDRFIVISNLQYERQEGWQRRHKIKGPDRDLWLTIPVLGSRRQLIKQAKTDNSKNWRFLHRQTIESCYSAKTNYREIMLQILEIYDSDWTRLVDINFAFIKLFKGLLNINTELILDEEVTGIKHQLLINVCKKYGAKTYLSGIGGKDYMSGEYFTEMRNNNIACQFLAYNTTAIYPYSTLHYLLSAGPEWIKEIISKN